MRTSRFIGLLGCARAWYILALWPGFSLLRRIAQNRQTLSDLAHFSGIPSATAESADRSCTDRFRVRDDRTRTTPGCRDRIFAVDLVEGPYGDYGWSELLSDTNGRFSVPKLFAGRRVS